MVGADDLFFRENISQPENRVNLALFSLMQQDWFREWFLKELKLDTSAVVYPPRQTKGVRPDFMVVSDGTCLAVIEVELARNWEQADNYRRLFKPKGVEVKTVWGRRNSGGDLSLEEILGFLEKQSGLPKQTQVNVLHLEQLIRDGLQNHHHWGDRGPVSAVMWEHPLVVALRSGLGNRLQATSGAVQMGHFAADAVGKAGFSLKVNRRDQSDKVALLSIKNGSSLVFPTRWKLNRCLPGHSADVEPYMSLVVSFGCNVDSRRDNATPELSLDANLDAVLDKMDELVPCLVALA